MNSLTREMADRWVCACMNSIGRILPVNCLQPDRFGFESPPGDPPVVLLNGQVVRDVFLTYNIDEVKRGKWID